MSISEQSIKLSLVALEQYSPKNRAYLKIVGKGSSQHLACEKMSWIGRIFMWLGWSSASMKKIAQFAAAHFESLYKHPSASKAHLTGLSKRIEHYNSNHRKSIQGLVGSITSAISRLENTVTKRLGAPNLKRGSAKMLQRKSTIKLIKTSLERTPQGTIDPDSPSQVGTTVPTLLPKPKILNAQIEIIKFRNVKNDVKEVYFILKHIVDSLQVDEHHSNIPELLKLVGKLTKQMTVSDIKHYISQIKNYDIFRIKEGSVYIPDPLFTSLCMSMSDIQVKALIDAVAASSDWTGNEQQYAFYKIAENISVFPNKSEFFDLIVSKDSFIKSVIRNPFLFKMNQKGKAENAIDAQLCAYFFRRVQNAKDPTEHQLLKSSLVDFRCARPYGLFENPLFRAQLSKEELLLISSNNW